MATKNCSKCGSGDIFDYPAPYSERLAYAMRHAGILGLTVFLPLTAIVAAVIGGKIYACRACKYEWHYMA